MKKYIVLLLVISIAGYVSLINAKGSIPPWFAQQANDSAKNNTSPSKRKYPEREHVNHLLDIGLNDSVIAYCNYLKNKDEIDIDFYNLSLAAAFYAKGQNPEAYQIVFKDIDYQLSLGAGEGNPFQMLYNYPVGASLAKDKFLEDMAFNKVNDYYKSLNYPETSIGLKLIKLQYQWKSINAFHDYEISLPDKDLKKDEIPVTFETVKTNIIGALKEIIDNNNQKLYSGYQIGTVSENQLTLINDLVLADSTGYWDKVMENSLGAKILTIDKYISYLMAVSKLPPNSPSYIQYKDSLCAKYECNMTSMYAISDSIILQVHYKGVSKTVDTLHISLEK